MNAGAAGLQSTPSTVFAPYRCSAYQNAEVFPVRQLVYATADLQQPLGAMPLVAIGQPPMGFFYEEKGVYNYPKVEVFFFCAFFNTPFIGSCVF